MSRLVDRIARDAELGHLPVEVFAALLDKAEAEGFDIYADNFKSDITDEFWGHS